MLDANRVLAALEARLEAFRQAETDLVEVLAVMESALETAVSLSQTEANSRLAAIPWPGARPTDDLDIFAGMVVPFAYRWNNHRQARQWALSALQGTPTFAVDGSQITPSKDVSLPIGLVQIGWFENPHKRDGRYSKAISLEILTADELARNGSLRDAFPDEAVNLRRFQGEIRRLIAYLEESDGRQPAPLCFFDGSLVISFVQTMHPQTQAAYVNVVKELLAVSEQTRIPVVGFVDSSYANDLTTMLKHLLNLSPDLHLSDAALLRPRMNWGDRSQVFICARDDQVLGKYYDQLCFTYLQTTTDNPPARVEFPWWVYRTGEHERLLDIIRAECIVGTGYPYVVETADAVAVLTAEDRERFYGLLQQFAEENQIPLRFSRKAISKRQRRM